MSTKAEPQQTVRFLISCIRHSNDGKVQSLSSLESMSPFILTWLLTLEKVDFQAVATELDIVSKAAAAKRYERLIKSTKDASNTKPTNTTAGAAAASDGDEKPAKPAATKRKALAQSAPKASPIKKAKAAPRGKKAKTKVEEETEHAEEDVKAESESSLSDAPENLDELVKFEKD